MPPFMEHMFSYVSMKAFVILFNVVHPLTILTHFISAIVLIYLLHLTQISLTIFLALRNY